MIGNGAHIAQTRSRVLNQYVLIIIVFLAFLVILRLRARSRRARAATPEAYARRIDGIQVTAYLEPEMPEACLLDHGMQFGSGFRRKTGPGLPHAPNCRCQETRFSFTSTEVFNGALRTPAEIRSSIAGLTPRNAQRMVDGMKAQHGLPLPASAAAYKDAVLQDKGFEQGQRPAMEAFLRQRFDFLQQRPALDAPRARDAEQAGAEDTPTPSSQVGRPE